MSILYLPSELTCMVIEDFSFRDLSILNRTCHGFYSFIEDYFNKEDIITDPLLPKEWSNFKKCIAVKSRSKIFPETLAFLDLTILLIRCMEQKDEYHLEYFLKLLSSREIDDFKWQQVYSRLIKESLRLEKSYEWLDFLFSRYSADQETLSYFFWKLVSIPEGWERRKDLQQLFSKYNYSYCPIDFHNSPKPRVEINQTKNRVDAYLKCGCFTEITDAILNNDNTRLAELLLKYKLTDELIRVIAITAIAVGRKDLLLYLESRIGYIPYYDGFNYFLDQLGLYEVQLWIKNRYAFTTKPNIS